MIGKLLKHEFLNSWLEITIICGVSIVLSIFTGAAMALESSVLLGLLILAIAALYIVAGIILLINIIKSFNNKIFGDEGYLTLTLPTSIDSILISKIIVNFIWMILVSASLIIGIILMVSIGSRSMLINEISEISRFVFNNIGAFALLLLNILIQGLFAIVLLIFVLSLLNIGKIKRAKFLIGIIIYYLISTLMTWLGSLVLIVPFEITMGYEGKLVIEKIVFGEYGLFIGHILNFNIMFWLLVGIFGLYFLSRYLIKNKIELE